MRTDVGTFVFRLHSQAEVAKITLEYPGSADPIVFHLRHHPPQQGGGDTAEWTLA